MSTPTESGQRRPVTLTVPEAAALLGFGQSTLYRKLQQGELPALRVGRAVRLRTSDVEKLLGQSLPPEGGGAGGS